MTLTFDPGGRSPRLSVIRVLLLRVPSANFVVWPTRVSIQCDLVTLTLEVMALAADADLTFHILHPHTNFEVLRPCHSEDMAHFVSALVGL